MEQEQVNTTRYPWDFDSLTKGDRITKAELLDKAKVGEFTPEYQFFVLSVVDELRKRKDGENISVAIVKGDVVLLDDRQAASHVRRLFDKGFRVQRRAMKEQGWVNPDLLTEDERKVHERSLQLNAWTMQGALMGRRGKLNLPPVERKTPSLMDGKE